MLQGVQEDGPRSVERCIEDEEVRGLREQLICPPEVDEGPRFRGRTDGARAVSAGDLPSGHECDRQDLQEQGEPEERNRVSDQAKDAGRMVGQLVFPQSRDRPSGNPDQRGEHGSRDREFDGLREENGNRLRYRHAALDGGSRVSPVSAQESAHVVEVLNRDGVPQMELLHDWLEERVVDVARAELRRAIDGDREVGTECMAQRERDDRDTEQRWDEDEEPANDVEDQAHGRSDPIRERDLKDVSRSERDPKGCIGGSNTMDREMGSLAQRSLSRSHASGGGGTPPAGRRRVNATAAIRARTFDRRTVRGPSARPPPRLRQRRTGRRSRRSTRPGSRWSWSYSAL